MRIIGIKSICCGKSVETLPLKPYSRRWGGFLYECLHCHKPCDHYYVTECESSDPITLAQREKQEEG